MQDRYAGDIGDFGKYGMLRFIFRDLKLKLGVNWCLVPNERGNADGMKISYLLGNKKLADCDPELYKRLRAIVKPVKKNGTVLRTDSRKVERIEKEHILPKNTVYFNGRLSFHDTKSIGHDAKKRRLKLREAWIDKGLDKLKDCDIVFFDPDNGFPVYGDKQYTIERHRKLSPKYIYHDEIAKCYVRKQSIIVYQHRDRSKKHKYLDRFTKAKSDIKDIGAVFYLSFHKGSARDYLFILTPKCKDSIMTKVKEMKKSSWFENGVFTHHNL